MYSDHKFRALGQAQKCGSVKVLWRDHNLPILNLATEKNITQLNMVSHEKLSNKVFPVFNKMQYILHYLFKVSLTLLNSI